MDRVENHPPNVKIQAHSDGIGGDQDLTRILWVVELGGHGELCVGGETPVDHGSLLPQLLQLPRHIVDVVLVKADNTVTVLRVGQAPQCLVLDNKLRQSLVVPDFHLLSRAYHHFSDEIYRCLLPADVDLVGLEPQQRPRPGPATLVVLDHLNINNIFKYLTLSSVTDTDPILFDF